MLSGILNTPQFIVLRTMGSLKSREKLGAGLMHKSGVTQDSYDRRFEIYSLVYVLRGKGIYRDDKGNAYPLSAGTLFQRFTGRKHTTLIEPDSDWAELYIDMGPTLYRGLESCRFIREDLPVINLKPDLRLISQFYEYLISLQSCPEEDLSHMVPELLTLINHVYSLSAHKESDESDMVSQACHYFLNHCHNRFDLKDFCSERGWGYEKFRKAFKKRMFLSPNQFIVRKRVDRACEWLLGSDLSVKEIGDRLGYPSPYEFSHQFKKVTGRSPREYKREQGN